MENRKTELKKSTVLLPSLMILLIIGFQLYTAQHLRGFWPKFRRLQYFHKLLNPPKTPHFWPFIDYPMYSQAKYEGDGINKFSVIGILDDSTEVSIGAEELGLDYWVYNYGFLTSLKKNDYEDLKNFAELYKNRNHRKLIGLRLENHPLVLSINSLNQGSKKVITTINLEALEEK